MKKIFCSVALVLLLCIPAVVTGAPLTGPDTEQAKLRFAATQHEVISILIREQEYERALSEFHKILDLNLENKTPVVQETWIVVNQLVASGQAALAYPLLDSVLPEVTNRDHRFTLLMLKGRVLKEEGRLNEALRVYRQAQEVQR